MVIEGADTTPRHTIGEVVARTGLTAHTLRWYERIGLLPPVGRSDAGRRRYSDRDLRWLEFVGRLRLTGMPVADMVRYADLMRAGDHTSPERRRMLEEHRDRVRAHVAQLQQTLLTIDRKIEGYRAAETP
ncbi:MerR family transcriptional regulator [Allostreptomyces psammosilenae]|uniref:MerR family transcriptional regulator n=1 Tax=Allostreptomyces psammosilenae TaxID=1892865 RepID=UPI00406BC86C